MIIFIDVCGQKRKGKLIDYQKHNNRYVVELNGLITGKFQIKIKPNQVCRLDYIKFAYLKIHEILFNKKLVEI